MGSGGTPFRPSSFPVLSSGIGHWLSHHTYWIKTTAAASTHEWELHLRRASGLRPHPFAADTESIPSLAHLEKSGQVVIRNRWPRLSRIHLHVRHVSVCQECTPHGYGFNAGIRDADRRTSRRELLQESGSWCIHLHDTRRPCQAAHQCHHSWNSASSRRSDSE